MEFFESALRQHDKVGRGQCYAIAICIEMTDDKVANELTNQNQSISQRPLLLSASRHSKKK